MANYHGRICLKHKENELNLNRDRCQHSSMTTALNTPSDKPQKLRGAHRFPSLLGLSYRKTMLSATWSLCSSKQSKPRLGQPWWFRINQSVCRALVTEPTPSQVSSSLGRFTCTPPSFKNRQGDGSRTTNVVLIIQH